MPRDKSAEASHFSEGSVTESPNYLVLSSPLGPFSIVWREDEGLPRIWRVFLSKQHASSEDLVRSTFAGATCLSHPTIAELGGRMQSFFEGQPVGFELDLVALEICSEFQQRVLLAEHAIPRGWVSTYGRIGRHLGIESGGRAVGNALARNPFPIIIPCPRAIRSNGELGGYQGGLAMKRALLALEGVQVSGDGKVLTPRVYY
jgi:methylated-DNA-[protein]-cysteine S-methyltransferase